MYDYELIRSSRRTISVEAGDDLKLKVRAPRLMTKRAVEDFLAKNSSRIDSMISRKRAALEQLSRVQKLSAEELSLLTARAKQIIPGRVAYYAPLLSVTPGRVTIRHQKSRWGSCSSKGNLNFNCLLLLAPPEVLDSVVVHELCHLKELNHSKNFYALVYSVFPGYDDCHRWLKENGSALTARI